MAKIQTATKPSQLLTPDAPVGRTPPKSTAEIDAEIDALFGEDPKEVKTPKVGTKPTLKTEQKKPGIPVVTKISESEKELVANGSKIRPSSIKEPKKEVTKTSDSGKIKVLNKTNPHKEGSNRASQFNLVVVAKSVSSFLESGGKIKYIERWVESGHISVE